MWAAWPVIAALAAGLLLWWFARVMLRRPCWRCNTPLAPNKIHARMLGVLPLVRCERCHAWRGSIFKALPMR